MRRTALLLLPIAWLAACDGPLGIDTPGVAQRDLLTAARRGDVALLRRALDAGAGVDVTDPNHRQTALIRAAMFGQAEAARALLAAGANVEQAGYPGDRRAVHWAAMQGNAEVVRVLLGAGAQVDVPDLEGKTPLDHALEEGSVDAVRALLDGGAAPERLGDPIAARIGMVLNPDEPPVRLEALLLVIATGRGLEVDGQARAAERTALLALAHRSMRPGAERVAAALVAAGADLRATDRKGMTARQVVEDWAPRQRDAAMRKTMAAVLEVLRQAEAKR